MRIKAGPACALISIVGLAIMYLLLLIVRLWFNVPNRTRYYLATCHHVLNAMTRLPLMTAKNVIAGAKNVIVEVPTVMTLSKMQE